MVIIASVHRKSIFLQTDWKKERECKIIHDPGANSKIVKPYIYIYLLIHKYRYPYIRFGYFCSTSCGPYDEINHTYLFLTMYSIHIVGLKNVEEAIDL